MKSILITEEIFSELQTAVMEKSAQQAVENAERASVEYRMARYAALGVDFVDTTEEIRLYANAVYNALMWGKGTVQNH